MDSVVLECVNAVDTCRCGSLLKFTCELVKHKFTIYNAAAVSVAAINGIEHRICWLAYFL